MMGPQLLPVNQFDHFYRGGDRIGDLRRGPGGPQRPEEWLASTTARFGQAPQGWSRLADGELLVEAVDRDPIAWLGEAHVARYGSSTEVLVKLLDLNQRLPVHLHPNRAFSRDRLGLAHGKTEAWYVLDAPEGAQVGVGFRESMSLTQVRDWVESHDSDALLGSLRRRTVRPGDAMLVPSGLPHSVDAGVFVLELQEPTDLSILLEWQGFAVDGDRDGHLDLGFEAALQALELQAVSDSDLDALVVPRERIEAEQLSPVFPAAADPYFRAHRLDASRGPVEVDAGFAVLLMLSGSAQLDAGSHRLGLVRGDAVLIPYATGPWTLRGPGVGVVSRPPSPQAPDGR